MRKGLAAGIVVLVVAAVAVAAYAFTRGDDEPDLELTGASGTRTSGGLRDVRGPGDQRLFAGSGTVWLLVTVRNPGKEPLKLSVPSGLSDSGITVADVGFLPTRRELELPGDFDASKVADTIPAGAQGVIVHRLELRCKQAVDGFAIASYPLDVAAGDEKPHPAKVDLGGGDLSFYEGEAAGGQTIGVRRCR